MSATADLRRIARRIDSETPRSRKDAAEAVGRVGSEEVRAQFTRLFGADHKLSGSKRSRKGGRKATVRAKVQGGRVEIVPSGDPVYINLVRGRGRSRNVPIRTRALSTPEGPRAWSSGGRLKPRPHLMDPAFQRITARAPEVTLETFGAALAKAVLR